MLPSPTNQLSWRDEHAPPDDDGWELGPAIAQPEPVKPEPIKPEPESDDYFPTYP